MYLKYFLYVMEHKWNVFVECCKMGMIGHGITHDLSKFLPSEFFPYARYFKGSDNSDINMTIAVKDFERAWLFHKNRNRHHWNYWVH